MKRTTFLLLAAFCACALFAGPAAAAPGQALTLARTTGNAAEVVHLVAGTAPKRPVAARVVTDSNCTPDSNGVSHCLNVLQLADGRTITVRHDHNMMLVPCLLPGETVEILK